MPLEYAKYVKTGHLKGLEVYKQVMISRKPIKEKLPR